MANKILIDWDKLKSGVDVLVEEENKMNAIFDEIRTETKKVPDFWQGRVSEETLREFKEFMKNFETTSTTCSNHIAFLNKVMEKYQNMDAAIGRALDSGSVKKNV